MNRTRKLVLSAIAGVLSLSIVGVAAPGAHADTAWPTSQPTGGR